ncbi:hypothetical protein E2562_014055 [Oryza meyeriana var. granulata]|uniref:Uncharacterized protein n=1 Tax=Oryza meyeriana var. granulata TaxID=110450 RepID=A0A6G1DIV4_9ORYZ|nr:hypothetical protein E2562_014055 [Oryza meyeriana var. granulata]
MEKAGDGAWRSPGAARGECGPSDEALVVPPPRPCQIAVVVGRWERYVDRGGTEGKGDAMQELQWELAPLN